MSSTIGRSHRSAGVEVAAPVDTLSAEDATEEVAAAEEAAEAAAEELAAAPQAVSPSLGWQLVELLSENAKHRPLFEELAGELKSPDQICDAVETLVGERLRTAIADLAFREQYLGHSEMPVTKQREFVPSVLEHIDETIPVEEDEREAFHALLQQELVSVVRDGEIKGSWGELELRDGDLVVAVNQESELPDWT